MRIAPAYSVLLLLVTLLAQAAWAQAGRKYQPLWPDHGNFLNRGWTLGAGITRTIPVGGTAAEYADMPNDTTYGVEYDPSGQTGFAFSVGRYLLPRGFGVLNLTNFDVGVRTYRGREEAAYHALSADPLVSDAAPRQNYVNRFSDVQLAGRLRVGNYSQLSDNSVLFNMLGIHADMSFYRNVREAAGVPGLRTSNTPPVLTSGLHYQVGYGTRISRRTVLVLTAETPLLTVWPWDGASSNPLWFHTRYRPLTIQASLWIADERPSRKCPEKASGGKRGKESLWGRGGPRAW